MLFGGAAAYQINQSLRFNSADSAYLNRTPASAGNRKTWTWSGWVKLGSLSSARPLFAAYIGSGSTDNEFFSFFIEDGLFRASGYSTVYLTSTAVHRDPSAWYHVVCVVDTANATANNRIRLYVNGTELTAFATRNNPSLNADLGINQAAQHQIGQNGGFGSYFNGYLAEVNFIDGTALTPSSFGETDTITGAWIPKKYSGSYGTNGFYLKYESSGIGTDSSGNGNNWTANNFAEEYSSVNYASNWIGSTSGTPYAGSWENVFNGNITVYADYVYAYNNTITLTFSTPLTGTIEVYGSDGGDGTANSGYIGLSDSSQWSINSVARASAYWYSFGSKTNITSITVSSPGGNGAILGAIRVNGQLLANNSAKATYDNFDDTPTNNYATLNPAIRPYPSSTDVITDGNLVFSSSNASVSGSAWATTLLTTGKWYYEATLTTAGPSNNCVGFSNNTIAAGAGTYTADARTYGWFYQSSGEKTISATTTSYGASYTTGDVIGVALDIDAATITFYKNNTSQGQLTGLSLASGSSGWLAAVEGFNGTVWNVNFGQRAFAYTPPTGFKALSTGNLPEPTIKKGGAHFNTTLWTGDSTSNRTITTGLQSDFIWIKRRDSAVGHLLFDAIRGAGKTLRSQSTDAESNDGSYYVQQFNSDNFLLGTSDSASNATGGTYVSWTWKANGAGSSNTAGTITSTVSANPTAGFSIVTYSGTSTDNATIGHGLGVAPAMVIVKNRTSALSGTAGGHWLTRHQSIGMTGSGTSCQLFLNLTNSLLNNDHGTLITSGSSLLQIKAGGGSPAYFHVGETGKDYVAYCFSEVAGYSKFGSYTGNGSSDGPFVFCGFRPAFIMIKRTNTTGNWTIHDNRRLGYNGSSASKELYPNLSNSEGTDNMDQLSNGFKLRDTYSDVNASGGTYIFAAFSETAFKFANAR